jgi:sirohydrochlorin cobaltochelatase
MDTNSNSQNKIGVLLVGHGSRLPYGKDIISQIADIYKEKTDYHVAVGFMNMSKPSIPAAINHLATIGVEKIVVTPVFLAPGVHTTQDIPNILGLNNIQRKHNHQEDQEHNHGHGHEEDVDEIQFKGEIIYTEPLGADERIANIIKDRVDDAL